MNNEFCSLFIIWLFTNSIQVRLLYLYVWYQWPQQCYILNQCTLSNQAQVMHYILKISNHPPEMSLPNPCQHQKPVKVSV